MQERGEAMEQAMAYVCCPAEESRVKVQRYCRKIYELGYVPICPRFGFLPFLDEGEAEDLQAYNRMSHLILKRCRMVVVCGKEVTGTMNTDISTAGEQRELRNALNRLRDKYLAMGRYSDGIDSVILKVMKPNTSRRFFW